MFKSEALLSWLEHALVVAGVAGVADLAANVAGLTSEQVTITIIGSVLGFVGRFLNKLPASTKT